jgi:hypothetical protein
VLQGGVVLADEVRIEPRRLAQRPGRGLRDDPGGTGESISTMRVIFTRPTCQLSIALTPSPARAFVARALFIVY